MTLSIERHHPTRKSWLAYILLILPIGVGASPSVQTSAPPTANVASAASTQDDKAVRSVIGLYVEAGRQGKSEIMRAAFLPQATIYGVAADGTLTGSAIRTLFDYVDTHSPASELDAKIASVEIIGNAAQVRLEANHWHGTRYTDLFQLLKVGGEWKILSKIYHTH
jgi:hypothetical protein